MGAKTGLTFLLMLSAVFYVLRRDDAALPVATDGSVTQLSFWNGFTGPDGRTMLRMVRQFNEANPDVQVTMQRMEWAIYYNKLMVAGIDGRGPELFVIHASTLPRMQRAGFIGGADALFDGPDAPPMDDFDPRLLDFLRFDGALLGVPLDVHVQGMYVNPVLLREAGIDHPPRTREEFVDAARKLRIDADGDGRPEQWGTAWTMWRNNFTTLVPQFGGEYFDSAGNCVLDCEQNVAALQFMVDMLNDGLVPQPENRLGWVGFRQGHVAMVWDGVYMLGDLQRLEGFEYEGAPIPQIGPYPGTHGDSHVLCIRAGLDDDTRAAALRFMRFLSDHGVEWAGAGQVPARASARETAEFQTMQAQHAMGLQLPHVKYPPRSPGLFELQQQIDFAVEKALYGRATPETALREARENFERFLQNAGLPGVVPGVLPGVEDER